LSKETTRDFTTQLSAVYLVMHGRYGHHSTPFTRLHFNTFCLAFVHSIIGVWFWTVRWIWTVRTRGNVINVIIHFHTGHPLLKHSSLQYQTIQMRNYYQMKNSSINC